MYFNQTKMLCMPFPIYKSPLILELHVTTALIFVAFIWKNKMNFVLCTITRHQQPLQHQPHALISSHPINCSSINKPSPIHKPNDPSIHIHYPLINQSILFIIFLKFISLFHFYILTVAIIFIIIFHIFICQITKLASSQTLSAFSTILLSPFFLSFNSSLPLFIFFTSSFTIPLSTISMWTKFLV